MTSANCPGIYPVNSFAFKQNFGSFSAWKSPIKITAVIEKGKCASSSANSCIDVSRSHCALYTLM